MKHILYNIASRSRPSRFKAVVASLIKFSEQPFTIIAKVDADDPTLPSYLRTDGVVFVVGKSENKIDAINRGIFKEGWDIIIDVSDDFVFTDPLFDRIVRENCGADDFLHFPEQFAEQEAKTGMNESISVMYCAGFDYYNRLGYIYNPIYKSLFCDNEATEVARKLGRYKRVEKDVFFHAHHLAGYVPKDDQYKHNNTFYQTDKETYIKRKAAGFP